MKKINGSVFGNISSVEDKLTKLEEAASDLAAKYTSVVKRTEALGKEVETCSSGRTRMENKLAQIDSKARTKHYE